MAYWDFLQMTPENQAAARNMSWGQAIKSEIPGTSNYRGYNPFYKGADATGLGGYLKQGGQSLAGNFQAGSNVGGATPLMRKLAMSPVARGIGTVGRVAGLANPMGAAAMSAWAAPKAIDYLTKRDPNATESSLFGIDLTQNANEQAALPESNLADWGFDSGVVPGDEIQETVTEETAPIRTDFGRIDPLTTNQKPGFFEGIGQKLGMTQVSPEDRAANKQFMQDKGIGRDSQTGRMYGGDWNEASRDFEGMNPAGESGWGSADFGEMSQNWMDKYGDVDYSQGIMGDMKRRKQARMKQRAAEYQAKIQQKAAAEKTRQDALRGAGAYSSQVQMDPGRGGTWHQQTAAKEAAGQQVAGPGFGKGAYFYQGGRVGLQGGGWSPGVGSSSSGYQSYHPGFSGGPGAQGGMGGGNLNIVKHPVESGAVVKGLQTAQKGMGIYNTVKSIKDMNPYGFILGKILQKATQKRSTLGAEDEEENYHEGGRVGYNTGGRVGILSVF